jgi:hypothetical protein
VVAGAESGPAPAGQPIPAAAQADWVFASVASAETYDHALTIATGDGLAISLACDNPQTVATIVMAALGGMPLGMDLNSPRIRTNAGNSSYDQTGEYVNGEGFEAIVGTDAQVFADLLVDLASGAKPFYLSLRNGSDDTIWYSKELPGDGAVEPATQLAALCLTDAQRAGILIPVPKVTGWELLEGEVAELLNSSILLRADSEGATGRLELRCVAETGYRQIAYYPIDAFEQQMDLANHLELAFIVGEGFFDFPYSVVGTTYSMTDLGIGSTDQPTIGALVDALAAAPRELTVSTRVDFEDWQPRKVRLGDASAIERFIAACPGR